MDINSEFWGIKFETHSDSDSFQKHIRVGNYNIFFLNKKIFCLRRQ
jgi:hypothetical protein